MKLGIGKYLKYIDTILKLHLLTKHFKSGKIYFIPGTTKIYISSTVVASRMLQRHIFQYQYVAHIYSTD